MGKKSTLDMLHPDAKKMAEEMTAFVPIKTVLSAGIAALYDLPPEIREKYFLRMHKIGRSENFKERARNAIDFIKKNAEEIRETCPAELHRLVEFFVSQVANQLNDVAEKTLEDLRQNKCRNHAKSG